MNAYRTFIAAAIILVVAACSQTDYAYMQEGQPHAEAIVREVSRSWGAEPLIADADPRMLKAFPESDIKKLIAECAVALGAVKQQKTLAGQVGVETAVPGKTALYTIDLQGEKGVARITVKLQKVDGAWKTLGFWVHIQPSGHIPASSTTQYARPDYLVKWTGAVR